MTVITRRTLDREALRTKQEIRQLREFLEARMRRDQEQSPNCVRSGEPAQDDHSPRLRVVRSA